MLIFRRTNCIITASGIVTPVNGRTVCRLSAAHNRYSVRPFTGVTIPDVVMIQFVLLKMSIVLFEIC